MSVSCVCGTEFPRDPRLEIACPSCEAKAGQECRRPSGHVLSRKTGFADFHAKRRSLAFELFPCRCVELWEKAQLPQQIDLLST